MKHINPETLPVLSISVVTATALMIYVMLKFGLRQLYFTIVSFVVLNPAVNAALFSILSFFNGAGNQNQRNVKEYP